MIIWLASYPKSGNTWVRFFLKSYFNLTNSSITLEAKKEDRFHILNFPNLKFMKEKNIKYSDFGEIVKNWNSMQNIINLNNKTNFLKTHNALCTIGNHSFTNSKNTIGAIYIIRDPRDVVLSHADHFGLSLDESVECILSSTHQELPEDGDGNNFALSLMGSWSDHYNSWKAYKAREIIIIRYEDLINNPFDTFLRIVTYLNKIRNFEIDINKVKSSIEEVKFENLQNMEKNEGFAEKGKGKKFFRSGKVGGWKNELKADLIKKIEGKFSKEMKELGYL
mgnify:CR=1 FL=1